MLGRPEMLVPVFMNVWAGSWLIASVCIERTMHRSSATSRQMSEELVDLLPALAVLLEAALRAEAGQLRALQLRDRLPLGERLGHRLAVPLGQFGLVVEAFEVGRAAGHDQEDDALGLGRDIDFLRTPFGRIRAANRGREERRQRDRPNAATGVTEESATLEVCDGMQVHR